MNALTGDFIPRSLATLAAGGRFLEIGKAEIYTPEHLAALQLRDGVSYTPIDLTRLLHDQPDLYGALLRDVVAQVQQGTMSRCPGMSSRSRQLYRPSA